MSEEYIEVTGAEEHNLKDLDVTLPRESLNEIGRAHV